MAGSSLFAGAAALALAVSLSGCRGGGSTPQLEPDPPAGPADEGVVRPVTMQSWGIPLGSGLDTLARELRPACIGDVWLEDAQDGPPRVRRLEHPFSQAELTELLGATDPVQRARLQSQGGLAMEVEAFAGDPRAVTFLYGAELRTGGRRLVVHAAELTPTTPAPGTPEFTARCGDEVAVEVEYGAQAFLLYRFWFQSDAARATFDRLVGTDVPLWELRERLAAADPVLGSSYGGSVHRTTHGLGGHTTTTVAEGDVRQLLQLPPGLDVADAFVEFVTTDGPGGLRRQARGSRGVIGVTFDAWASILYPLRTSVIPPAPRVAPAEVLEAREALAALLADRLRARDRIRTRQDLGSLLRAEQDAVDGDVAVLRDALEACHDLSGADDDAAVARCTTGASPEGLTAAGYRGTPALADL